MAPETVLRKPRTGSMLKKSDVHAVGVITYIMMSGRPPFGGKTEKEIWKKIRDNDWKFPDNVSWSDPLQDFVSLCMDPDTVRRLSARRALEHPWIIGEDPSSVILDDNILESLDFLHKETRLQKALVTLLVKDASDHDYRHVESMFKKFDTRGNGVITEDELTLFFLHMGLTAVEAMKKSSDLYKSLGEAAEGGIDFNTFMNVIAKIQLTKDDAVTHAIFNTLDKDSTGIVKTDDLAHFLGRSRRSIGGMMREIQVDHPDHLTFEEWNSCLNPKKIAHIRRSTLSGLSRGGSVRWDSENFSDLLEEFKQMEFSEDLLDYSIVDEDDYSEYDDPGPVNLQTPSVSRDSRHRRVGGGSLPGEFKDMLTDEDSIDETQRLDSILV